MNHSELLCIRADADPHMGTGHVMRCLALAGAWQKAGGTVCFLTSCTNQPLLDRLRAQRIAVRTIAAPWPGKNDRDVAAAIDELQPAWLVVDGYHFDGDYQRQLRELLNPRGRLLVVDDFGHLDGYDADLVVNPNIIGELPEITRRYGGARILCGPAYAMVRNEFTHAAGALGRQTASAAMRILVTMGGADPANQTGKVLEAMEKIGGRLRVRVIVGAANRMGDAMKRAASRSRHDVVCLTDVRDMARQMGWADIAIAAAGSTCWELCCLGVPAIVITVAENQRIIASGLSRAGACVSLGWHEQVATVQLQAAVESLLLDHAIRQRMSRQGRELVDGRGAARVVEMMRSFQEPACSEACDIVTRPARPGDCQWMYAWRNHPVTRQYASDPKPIDNRKHCAWFEQALTLPSRKLLVVEKGGIPVGVIRFDLSDDRKKACVSIYIDPDKHGQGLGFETMQQGIDWLRREKTGDNIEELVATVRQGNVPSQALFKKAGFVEKSGNYRRPLHSD